MRPPGWFVRERDIVIVCLLALTSLLLAVRSGFDSHRSANAERRAEDRARLYEGARDSLLALQCVLVKPGSSLRVFPPSR